MKRKTYALCEAVADIAFIAGTEQYYNGDSRQDIADIIEWAVEFEKIHKDKEWGTDELEYIEEIEIFTLQKLHAMKTTTPAIEQAAIAHCESVTFRFIDEDKNLYTAECTGPNQPTANNWRVSVNHKNLNAVPFEVKLKSLQKVCTIDEAKKAIMLEMNYADQ